ncbi:MAG: hypothetical protein PHC33_04285, partial [Candidatus Omnitrophica bacterium]|nr:hypothetical protein [Candidatus Omnitrophota bacterium]
MGTMHLVQAILSLTENDLPLTAEELSIGDNLIIVKRKTNHDILCTENAKGYAAIPGLLETMSRIFSIVVVMQTKKVPERPFALIDSREKEFYTPIKNIIADLMYHQAPEKEILCNKEDLDLFRVFTAADDALKYLLTGIARKNDGGASAMILEISSGFLFAKIEIRLSIAWKSIKTIAAESGSQNAARAQGKDGGSVPELEVIDVSVLSRQIGLIFEKAGHGIISSEEAISALLKIKNNIKPAVFHAEQDEYFELAAELTELRARIFEWLSSGPLKGRYIPRDPRKAARLYAHASRDYRNAQNTLKEIECAERSLALDAATGDSRQIIQSLIFTARIYRRLGNLLKSAEYNLFAAELADSRAAMEHDTDEAEFALESADIAWNDLSASDTFSDVMIRKFSIAFTLWEKANKYRQCAVAAGAIASWYFHEQEFLPAAVYNEKSAGYWLRLDNAEAFGKQSYFAIRNYAGAGMLEEAFKARKRAAALLLSWVKDPERVEIAGGVIVRLWDIKIPRRAGLRPDGGTQAERLVERWKIFREEDVGCFQTFLFLPEIGWNKIQGIRQHMCSEPPKTSALTGQEQLWTYARYPEINGPGSYSPDSVYKRLVEESGVLPKPAIVHEALTEEFREETYQLWKAARSRDSSYQYPISSIVYSRFSDKLWKAGEEIYRDRRNWRGDGGNFDHWIPDEFLPAIRFDKKLPYVIVEDYERLSETVTLIAGDLIRKKPEAVMIVPGCNTPLGFYRKLAGKAADNEVDISRARFVTVDSPIGLRLDDTRNFKMYMYLHSYRYTYGDIPPNADKEHFLREFYEAHPNLIVPYVPKDAGEEEAQDIAVKFGETLKELGGADLAFLGLGLVQESDGKLIGGHIGFNEPGSSMVSRARIVELTDFSVETKFRCALNAPLWDEVDCSLHVFPRKAITLGIADILSSRNIIIAASGTSKSREVRYLLEAEMTSDFPATYLHTVPEKTLVIVDEAAAVLLAAYRIRLDGGEERAFDGGSQRETEEDKNTRLRERVAGLLKETIKSIVIATAFLVAALFIPDLFLRRFFLLVALATIVHAFYLEQMDRALQQWEKVQSLSDELESVRQKEKKKDGGRQSEHAGTSKPRFPRVMRGTVKDVSSVPLPLGAVNIEAFAAAYRNVLARKDWRGLKQVLARMGRGDVHYVSDSFLRKMGWSRIGGHRAVRTELILAGVYLRTGPPLVQTISNYFSANIFAQIYSAFATRIPKKSILSIEYKPSSMGAFSIPACPAGRRGWIIGIPMEAAVYIFMGGSGFAPQVFYRTVAGWGQPYRGASGVVLLQETSAVGTMKDGGLKIYGPPFEPMDKGGIITFRGETSEKYIFRYKEMIRVAGSSNLVEDIIGDEVVRKAKGYVPELEWLSVPLHMRGEKDGAVYGLFQCEAFLSELKIYWISSTEENRLEAYKEKDVIYIFGNDSYRDDFLSIAEILYHEVEKSVYARYLPLQTAWEIARARQAEFIEAIIAAWGEQNALGGKKYQFAHSVYDVCTSAFNKGLGAYMEFSREGVPAALAAYAADAIVQGRIPCDGGEINIKDYDPARTIFVSDEQEKKHSTLDFKALISDIFTQRGVVEAALLGACAYGEIDPATALFNGHFSFRKINGGPDARIYSGKAFWNKKGKERETADDLQFALFIAQKAMPGDCFMKQNPLSREFQGLQLLHGSNPEHVMDVFAEGAADMKIDGVNYKVPFYICEYLENFYPVTPVMIDYDGKVIMSENSYAPFMRIIVRMITESYFELGLYAIADFNIGLGDVLFNGEKYKLAACRGGLVRKEIADFMHSLVFNSGLVSYDYDEPVWRSHRAIIVEEVFSIAREHGYEAEIRSWEENEKEMLAAGFSDTFDGGADTEILRDLLKKAGISDTKEVYGAVQIGREFIVVDFAGERLFMDIPGKNARVITKGEKKYFTIFLFAYDEEGAAHVLVTWPKQTVRKLEPTGIEEIDRLLDIDGGTQAGQPELSLEPRFYEVVRDDSGKIKYIQWMRGEDRIVLRSIAPFEMKGSVELNVYLNGDYLGYIAFIMSAELIKVTNVQILQFRYRKRKVGTSLFEFFIALADENGYARELRFEKIKNQFVIRLLGNLIPDARISDNKKEMPLIAVEHLNRDYELNFGVGEVSRVRVRNGRIISLEDRKGKSDFSSDGEVSLRVADDRWITIRDGYLIIVSTRGKEMTDVRIWYARESTFRYISWKPAGEDPVFDGGENCVNEYADVRRLEPLARMLSARNLED